LIYKSTIDDYAYVDDLSGKNSKYRLYVLSLIGIKIVH
jgi:hypothetical protein